MRPALEALALAAWVEPDHLPPGGGTVNVFVRVSRGGGKPYPDVDVMVSTNHGALASRGRVLVSDTEGSVRDTLTTRRTATLTINAGGTIYRFPVPVLPASADPNS